MNVAPIPLDAALRHALVYAQRGWHVFPCNPLTKKPMTTNGYLDACTDPDTIREWWRKSPNAMIGCATGPKSGFWALDADVDPAEGKDGVAEVAKLGPPLPDTVEQTTPRGGHHKLFRWDDSRPVRNSVSKLGPGVDTRGDGGYVILAGSVRKDGAVYQWSISPENGEIREAPDWLYEEIRKIRSKPEISTGLNSEFPFEVEVATADAIRILKHQCGIVAATTSGSRNNALNDAAFQIGIQVGQGFMSATKAREGLAWAASACGLNDDDGEESAHKTITSGLTAGTTEGVKKTPAYWDEPVEVGTSAPTADSEGRAESTPALSTWSRPATVFAGKSVPAQRWLVKEMIPARVVTLLYGDGGTGKSLISLQLVFGVSATGKWLGMDVPRGPTLFVTAEDEDEEVHRRISAVSQGSGVTLDDLGDLHWRSLAGQEAVLAVPDASKGVMAATKVLAALRAEIMRVRPILLVLDTLADLFGGDEIKRVQARQFIQLLQGLIVGLPWDMSIVLLAHPSVAGMNSGTGTSGSTAWSNSVRSRLYLERRTVKRGKDEPPVEIDPDIRVLSTKKANRTKQGGEIVVRWSAGRFLATAAVAPTRNSDADALDEKTFLDLLAEFDRTDRPVSPNKSSPTYAPRMFTSDPNGEQVGVSRLEGAMSRLLSQNSILVTPYGPPAKRYKRLAKSNSDLFG